jgi:alpha-L-fucosidase
MKRRQLLKQLATLVPATVLAQNLEAAEYFLNPQYGKIARGPFSPTWNSLSSYQTPEWFKNAKFGIWAHWGPQCQPEYGDWYAREMYMEGSRQYKYHLEKYGHPSKFGFKDVINEWKAELWDPEKLMALYKKAGAKYFVSLANHHDNFDLYASKYQKTWNSTKLGPKKDIVGGWAKAAKNNDLRFGVSVHAAHTWSWMETAQRADKNGPFAGIPYDGKITKADGKGKWWQGLDPQELYEQNHPLSENSHDNGMIHRQWDWGNGVAKPSKAYIDKFYNRTIELVDKYNPDLMYFDDTALPFCQIDDSGLKIAAHMYNKSIKEKGDLEAVITGKILNEIQKKSMIWDIERGQSNQIEPLPWQTCTCIGHWHYDRTVYNNKHYKSAKTVVHMLVDVVSKNGNLLLSVPMRGDGTIDEQEHAIVEEIGEWMSLNSEGIYDTRPWKVFGEGPAMEDAAPLRAQGFNEGRGKGFGSSDIRFTTKDNAVYAIVLGWPETGKTLIKSLADGKIGSGKAIANVEFVGSGQKLQFNQSTEGLLVSLPQNQPKNSYAFTLKIT